MAAFCADAGVSPERLGAILGDAYRSPDDGSVERAERLSPSLGHLILDLETVEEVPA